MTATALMAGKQRHMESMPDHSATSFPPLPFAFGTASIRATLCFVLQSSNVLMIRKKRGLGAGKINGVGGKLEKGETPEECVVREAKEELGIALSDPVKRGELYFQFLDGMTLFCTVYVATEFSGVPHETDEAIPLWFPLDKIPFNEMWEDDKLWLRQVLDGQSVRGSFFFDGDKLLKERVEWLA